MSFTEYKAWADEFEKLRRISTEWPLSQLSKNDTLIYLVADGACSTSIYPGRSWASRLNDVLTRARCPGRVRAFSYNDYGLHYLGEDTLQELQWLQTLWVNYMEQLDSHQRIIPICFSFGATVALLGLHKWLQSSPSDRARVVPAIILVSPALAPSKHLLEGYEEKLRLGELAEDIPPPVLQLCNPNGQFKQYTDNALRYILELGEIDIHIIFWPADELVPYKRGSYSLKSDNEHPIMTDKPLENRSDAIAEHRKIRDAQETDEQIIEILSQYR